MHKMHNGKDLYNAPSSQQYSILIIEESKTLSKNWLPISVKMKLLGLKNLIALMKLAKNLKSGMI